MSWDRDGRCRLSARSEADLARLRRELDGPEQACESPRLCGDLRAVRNGCVYAVKGSLLHRPGPRLVDGVELLVGVLHPLRMRPGHTAAAIRKVA